MTNNVNNCSESHSGLRAGFSLSKLTAIVLGLVSFILYACGASREEMEYQEKSMEIADSVARYSPGLATDTINGITHNFIRTADMKLKVKNVTTVSQKIEDLVSVFGAYISKSELLAENEFTRSVRVSEDSIKEITHYTMVNYLSIRVPNKLLDTVLRRITNMAVFINYSRTSADDVKLKLFANSLAGKRNTDFVQKLTRKVEQNQGKLNQITAAEEKALEKQEVADASRIDSYDLADQVNYSTLKLHLYQSNTVHSQTLFTPPIIENYEPSFFSKLAVAMQHGFNIIKKFVLFLAECWGGILIIAAFFYLLKKGYERFNRKVITPEKQV